MQSLRRDVPVLHEDDPVRDALRTLLAGDLPALPVVDAQDHYAGVFGEREFLEAAFPGYFKDLKFAGFLSEALDSSLEQRAECLGQPVGRHLNREHVDVSVDGSNAQLAETFLHHRVLIVPVLDGHRVVGVVRRADFFRAVADRLLAAESR